MFIGYLDSNKKNISIEKQHQIIEQHAIDTGVVIDMYVCEEDIQKIVSNINTCNHTILISNIVCLGSTLQEVMNNLRLLSSHGLSTISISDNYKFIPNEEIEALLKGVELSIDIRNSMVSTITKNALDKKRASGHKLGRGFGSKNKKRIWEGKEEQISRCINSGLSREQTAKEVGISIVSLYNYLRQNSELKHISGGQNA